jgi:26S proteasome regulatory subunit T3
MHLVSLLGWKMSAAAEAGPRQNAPEDGGDMYVLMKQLQRQLEFIAIQEGYVKDETQNLKRELLRAQEEVKRIKSVPLVIGNFSEMIDAHHGIGQTTSGSSYYVRVLSTIDKELLKPGCSVAMHRHSNSIVDILPADSDTSVQLMGANDKVRLNSHARIACDTSFH